MTDLGTNASAARWEEAFRHVSRHSPYYRELFHGRTTVPQLREVPTVDKAVLSERNLDFLCVPRERIIDIVTTSGTTGQPLAWMLTDHDLQRLGACECLGFQSLGITPSDTVLLAVTLDRCFIAGMAYALGLRKLGCATLRAGPASPMLVLDCIERFRPSAIVGVPSFLRLTAAKARETGTNLRDRSVRKAICIGEPIRGPDGKLNSAGTTIESEWNARVFSTYGVTELSACCCECEAGAGAHVPAEWLHVEILDDAGQQVPDGTVGEVTATTFGVEGMPVVRFRTGDCAAMYSHPCRCGRMTPRIGPIVGRKQQKLKIKGASVFPIALQSILDEAAGVNSYAIIATAETELSDLVEVVYDGEAPPESLREVFQAAVKIAPQIRRASAQEIETIQLPPHARKRRVFVDRRGKT
jgi:phenylacetate-CoA ligase